jgi:hypothetical protein
MYAVDVTLAVLAFVLVAGYAALAWLRHGRDPRYVDDPSILLPAPPPAMTAATATIVLGEDRRTAFITALLDLASRDEIAFVVETRQGGVDEIGIALRGGESTDPQVRLNRRNPIGEGEAWLLGEMKAWNAAEGAKAAGLDDDGGIPSPAVMQAGMQMMGALMRTGLQSAADDDSPAARAAREHGLLNGPFPDMDRLAAQYAAQHGRPMDSEMLARFGMITAVSEALKEPIASGEDPDAYLDRLETRIGRKLSAEERTQGKEWLARLAEMPAATPSAETDYITAAQARRMPVASLLGPMLQRYAQRHGWVVGLPLFARLKWRLIGVVEVVAGLAVAVVGAKLMASALIALGAGVAAGGGVTYVIAPAMPSRSVEGSVMRAQLAAYRRTLAASLAESTSLADVAASSRLDWLETPDQTFVWAVALGLQQELQAFFRRLPQGGSELVAMTPGAGNTASRDAAAVFAGINAIGAPAAERPSS